MSRRCLFFALLITAGLVAGHRAQGAQDAPEPTFDLTARLKAGDAADVAATLEVGGDLLTLSTEGEKKLPLSIVAKHAYAERLVAWSADDATAARSVRRYSTAEANSKTDVQSDAQVLAKNKRVVVVDVSDLGAAFCGLEGPLSRDELILLDAVGNTLVLDRLLPGKSLAEGDGWDHGGEVIGALLGMDRVAVCDVRSVVTGEDRRQVQIRMAGTVHGAIQGSATELELRAAYLFHLDQGRITKFNLAIKEHRKPGDVAPGLDVVAKLSIVAKPLAGKAAQLFDQSTLDRATAMTRAEARQLLVDAPARGYRFQHDMSWHLTAEQRELMSLRLLDEGDTLAQCNISTQPARSAEKPLTLQDFEKYVCTALGDKVNKVAAATEWTTPAGQRCLAVFVDGRLKAEGGLEDEVEVQWRYYNLTAPDMPQAMVAVTVEQAVLERFADADRGLVDSLELVTPPKTAAAEETTKK